jgi:proteasome accessory factor B
MVERVDRTERLLNLVIALMAAPRALPRQAIRSQVPGYSQASTDSSFERMFERDKDELRSMGIPVETVIEDTGEVLGYRIRHESYAMQPLDLSLAERSALVVAAQVWGQAVVAPLAGTAVRKLEAVVGGAATWVPASLGGTVQLTSADAALLPMMQAIRTDRVVTFSYQTPAGDQPMPRTLSPWRLAVEDGHWRITGHDHDRQATRTFRLSRIVGIVTLTSEPRVPPSTEAAPNDGDDGSTPHRAVLRVRPGGAAALRRCAVRDPHRWTATEIEVELGTHEALVRAVCAAGTDAVVLSPPDLARAVRQRLEAFADEHSGEQS